MWLLVLGIVPVILTSVLGHWVMTRAAINATGQHLLAVSQRAAADVDLRMRELVRGMNELGTRTPAIRNCVEQSNSHYHSPDSSAIDRRIQALSSAWQNDSAHMTRALLNNPVASALEQFRSRDPVLYTRLLVTDSSGIMLGATAPPGRIHYSDQQWWQTAFNRGQGAVYISKLYYADGNYLLNIATPVLDSSGSRTVGIIRVLANVSELAELIEDIEVGQTGFATLISTFGDVLIAPFQEPARAGVVTTDRLHRLTTSFPIWYLGRGLMHRTNAVIALSPVLSTSSHSRANLGGSGWTVSVEQSKAEILAPAHHFGRTAVFVFLLTAAVVMVVGFFLSERIIRPLRELRDGVQRIGAGRLDLRLDLRTGDEIETLAGEFNAMTERLEQSYHGLEEKIRDATAELSREKDSFQAVVTSLGEGLMVVNPQRQIVMWNRAAEKMTGFSSEEVIGQPCTKVLRTGSEKQPGICATDCPVAAASAQRQTVTRRDMTTYILNRDGSRLPVNYTASPLFDEQDEIRGCVVVLRDISQEKEMDRLKSDMISMVSHELRTPLQAIIGFAEMLQDKGIAPDKRREFLRIVIEQGRRLSNLVDKFLTLSRIEAGKFELNLQQVDIGRIADELFSIEAEHHPRHKLINDIPESFPQLRADPERIKRVIHNLISNAIKYSPAGGPVTVSAHDLGEEVDISVEDHGIGIRDQDIPKLFHRFQRVNPNAALEVSGTGLGLSICKSIVKEHDGTIRVVSEYGKGSTFTITLPKRGPKEKPDDREPVRPQ